MSDWTVNTLKEHIEVRLSEMDERTKLAFTASQRAVDKAEESATARLEAHNKIEPKLEKLNLELRAEMSSLMRSDVAEQRFTALTDAREARFKAMDEAIGTRIAAVEKKTDDQDTRLDMAAGRFGGFASAGNLMIVLLGLVLMVGLFVLNHTL